MGAIISILTGILKFKSQRIYAFHCTKKQILIKWNEMENRKSDTLFQRDESRILESRVKYKTAPDRECMKEYVKPICV